MKAQEPKVRSNVRRVRGAGLRLARPAGMAMLAVLMVLAVWGGPVRAQQVTDQTMMIGRAVTTVERLRSDPNFSQTMTDLLGRARAVLIVPDLVKAGFFFGAQYGTGVLLALRRVPGIKGTVVGLENLLD